MNQGGEGIKEVKLTSGSKSLSLSFQACSGLSVPGGVQRLPPALPFKLLREVGGSCENLGLAGHAEESQNPGSVLLAAGVGVLSAAILL